MESKNSSMNSTERNNIQPKGEVSKDFERIHKSSNYYEILGVSSNASLAEIKQQYKRLSLIFHPDKNFQEFTSEFQKIEQAYRELNDPVKRQDYDASLVQNSSSSGSYNKVGPPEGCTYFFRTETAPCKKCGKELNLYTEPFPFFCPFCKGITNLFPPANYSKSTFNLGDSTVGITPQGVVVMRNGTGTPKKNKKRKKESKSNSLEEEDSEKKHKPRKKRSKTTKQAQQQSQSSASSSQPRSSTSSASVNNNNNNLNAVPSSSAANPSSSSSSSSLSPTHHSSSVSKDSKDTIQLPPLTNESNNQLNFQMPSFKELDSAILKKFPSSFNHSTNKE